MLCLTSGPRLLLPQTSHFSSLCSSEETSSHLDLYSLRVFLTFLSYHKAPQDQGLTNCVCVSGSAGHGTQGFEHIRQALCCTPALGYYSYCQRLCMWERKEVSVKIPSLDKVTSNPHLQNSRQNRESVHVALLVGWR